MPRVHYGLMDQGLSALALTGLILASFGWMHSVHAQNPSPTQSPSQSPSPSSSPTQSPSQSPSPTQTPSPSPPIFENVIISPKGFQDPLEVKGIGGGSVSAKEVAGQTDTPTGTCGGYLDREPDHTLELKGYFEYLSVQVQSGGEDTMMVVKGPGGLWCNDDVHDKDPAVEGEWLPGTYQVWVGTYHKDKLIPYTLRITETR